LGSSLTIFQDLWIFSYSRQLSILRDIDTSDLSSQAEYVPL